MKTAPDHQIRYARAWALHQDEGLDEASREACEREMDSAQNDFSFAEFQGFKDELPGFVEYWNGILDKELARLSA